MKLTSNQKLDLINSMDIIDSSCAGGECEYVLVEDNEANRNILSQIGIVDEDIEKYVSEEAIDISMVAWERTDANWYGGKEKGFYVTETIKSIIINSDLVKKIEKTLGQLLIDIPIKDLSKAEIREVLEGLLETIETESKQSWKFGLDLGNQE